MINRHGKDGICLRANKNKKTKRKRRLVHTLQKAKNKPNENKNISCLRCDSRLCFDPDSRFCRPVRRAEENTNADAAPINPKNGATASPVIRRFRGRARRRRRHADGVCRNRRTLFLRRRRRRRRHHREPIDFFPSSVFFFFFSLDKKGNVVVVFFFFFFFFFFEKGHREGHKASSPMRLL